MVRTQICDLLLLCRLDCELCEGRNPIHLINCGELQMMAPNLPHPGTRVHLQCGFATPAIQRWSPSAPPLESGLAS